jgi:arginyl-tRNA synthetase
MELKKLIETTINEYLNEGKKTENKLNINFKKWFSGSKIVENGKPMICYHGSKNKGINVFDIKKIGQNTGNEGHYGYGIYFSTDIREAKTYGSEIYECYINIKKPFIGDNKEILKLKRKGVDNIDELEILSIDFNSFKNSFINNNLIYDFLTNIEKKGIEYAWDNISKQDNNIDYDLLNDITDIIEYTTLNKNANGVPNYIIKDLNKLKIKPKLNKGFAYNQSLHWITDLGNRSKYVTEVIKNLGYDGIFYGSEIVVFNPNQIKSVNNDGSWDIDDNDIYS